VNEIDEGSLVIGRNMTEVCSCNWRSLKTATNPLRFRIRKTKISSTRRFKQTEEVLLRIAEHRVNADGSLSGAGFEKALVFPDYLASCLSPSDSIAVTMLRDGNIYEENVQLE